MFITTPPTEAEWAALDKSDHSSRALSVLVINGLFLGLVAVVMGLRLFTKTFMTAKLFLDDYLMTGAAVIFTAVCIINIRAVHFGFGNHVWDLSSITASAGTSSLADLNAAAAPVELSNYISLILIAPAIILAKLSVLTILLRVFPASMRGLRAFLLAMGVVLTLCCVTQSLLVAFQCSPIQASWNVWAPDPQACYIEPLQVVTMALGAVNVATDLAICVTPIPYFWRLNISRAQKICLCAVFASGLIACIVSIVRMVSLQGLNDNLDVTYVAVPYFSWSIVEAALIIITGSMPFLRPLLATILPDFFSAHNFTSLFQGAYARSRNRASVANKLDISTESTGLSSIGSKEKRGCGGGLSSSGGSGKGDVTITTEFYLEEMSPGLGGFDTRPPGTPSTPLAPRMGFRTMVTCEKSRV